MLREKMAPESIEEAVTLYLVDQAFAAHIAATDPFIAAMSAADIAETATERKFFGPSIDIRNAISAIDTYERETNTEIIFFGSPLL